MLLIEHPASYAPEREYILRILLNEFLGIHYRTSIIDGCNVRISNVEGSRHLLVADVLFQTPESTWLTSASLPHRPLERLRMDSVSLRSPRLQEDVPVIYGRADIHGRYAHISSNRIDLGVDIFGGAFFCLTRYEELISNQRDRHNRFPASASLSYQEGFLDRPIVNEYVELLWSCLSRLFPELRRRVRLGSANVTFDIDWPAMTLGLSMPAILHASGADIVRRREPLLAARRLASWLEVRKGNIEKDIGNNFDAVMDACEAKNLQAVFYVITGGGRGDVDGSYVLEHPWIRRLLRTIHDRGHQIGLHPTYQTYRDVERTREEFERLLAVCEREGIQQSNWGARQHYLRWEAPTTWQNYEDIGLSHDSTLGFADNTGFRSGTCYEYPVFNLRTRSPLYLRERPLIAMDATLFGMPDKYGMNLSTREAVDLLKALSLTCQRHNGDFTLLWHNNWLVRSNVSAAFSAALEVPARPERYQSVKQ